MAVAVPTVSSVAARPSTPSNERVPNVANITISPIRKPRSPIRLTTNAFLAAAAALGRVNQNPISRYEQRPTSSQPMKSMA